MQKKIYKTMDGNEAAAYVAYAFTEVAAIYPITPSSPMADYVDDWSVHGKKNLFNQTVKLVEMQAESGACAAIQGALEAGSLASTYTSSQGLLLMVPAMYRIAGLQLPGVMHVAARTLSSSTITILGDHSDVMACRQTGWAQLASSSVQEVMDLGAVAHLSAIKGSVPVQHFFEGFRTSHEIQKIEVLDYTDFGKLLDYEALDQFRKRALNPERPTIRNCAENDDIYFQHREACNSIYNAFPDVVAEYMEKINSLTGRNYKPFNYYGDPKAERIIVAMGSVCETLKETVDYLNERGEAVGFIQTHLYRPFSAKYFLSVIPETVKIISVIDRTKEPGSIGEPLFEDVCVAIAESGRNIKILGGRYGLSSKDTTPAQMKAVYDNMAGEAKNHFTVGIIDDVTHTSIPIGEDIAIDGKSTISCKFWGLGSDGTVGANKSSIKIIGDNTNQYVQAYFQYDAKKSGGLTRSHLRFGHDPICSPYYVTQADFIACHQQNYLVTYDVVREAKNNSILLLNTHWDIDDLDVHLPNRTKRQLSQKHIRLYTIDATRIAAEIGLGNKVSVILQAAFFKLSGVIPVTEAAKYMRLDVEKKFAKKGDNIVKMNCSAIDRGFDSVKEIAIPAAWAELADEMVVVDKGLPEYVKNIMLPVNNLKGDDLPVSTFKAYADGVVPTDTAKYEKRGVADKVPVWNSDLCIGCNKCSLVCPHAAIRPFLFDEAERVAAPASCVTKTGKNSALQGLFFRIQVDVLDCQGCGSCVQVCPVKNKALEMVPLDTQIEEQKNWDYCLTLSQKTNPMSKFSSVGSQYEQPLYEFSGACPGCGETPYIKLVTQLFGDRMYVANATGCTQAVGFFTPTFPQTVNSKGYGPTFSNSLFENNAEFAMGISLSIHQLRAQVKDKATNVVAATSDTALKVALENWMEHGDEEAYTVALSDSVKSALEKTTDISDDVAYLKNNIENLTKKSVWMYGGDGWAYDIGFGGIDHVLAAGIDINALVVDTEVYSNTGGQASKATPLGAVAQFASGGKATPKKDLGLMLMTYGYIYVAQISLGANSEHAIRCLKEAAEYNGPSIIIAYAPCINHGLSNGLRESISEEKRAVDSGYWPLYHYNPSYEKEGKNPFVLDSKAPDGTLRDLMMNESRFTMLKRSFPEAAEKFFAEAEEQCIKKYQKYKRMAGE